MKKFSAAHYLSAALLIVVGFLIGSIATGSLVLLPNFNPFGTKADSHDTAIVQAVKRQQKVQLLSLSVQGITDQTITSQFLGQNVPGTSRTLFLQYNYDALLGIDGSQVLVEKTGDHSYKITVPDFEFLGHSDVHFKKAVEKNGLISWVTPEVDVADLVTKVLNSDVKSQQINNNLDVLKDQAKSFYSGLVHGVDPLAEVTMVYSQA